jgi:uracil-DNA glycosylase
MNATELHERFLNLVAQAQTCQACPQMSERTAVLSLNNGSLRPRVLFVAEAPGRRGGDRTRVPMSGDASGRTFQRLLASIGLSPGEVFITNAVLCNPRSETGANRPPRSIEVRNCNAFLRKTICLLDPRVIVSIGGTALAALGRIEPHGLTVGEDVARCVEWFGRTLIPLYHPSPQVLISRRSLAEQEEDWKALGRMLGQGL